jgi:hypothetical protein
MSSGLLPAGLTREQVIRLSGSTARLDYRPAKPEPLNYHCGEEQKQIETRTRADWHVIVGMVLCGTSAQIAGLAYGITRQAVEKRLRLMPATLMTLRRPLGKPKKLSMPAEASITELTVEERLSLARKRGGSSRAQALSAEQRQKIAQAAARARWGCRGRSRF